MRDALAAEEPRKRRRFNRRIRTAPGGIFGRIKKLVHQGVCGPKIERPGSPIARGFDRPTLVVLIQLNFPPRCKPPWALKCPGKDRSFSVEPRIYLAIHPARTRSVGPNRVPFIVSSGFSDPAIGAELVATPGRWIRHEKRRYRGTEASITPCEYSYSGHIEAVCAGYYSVSAHGRNVVMSLWCVFRPADPLHIPVLRAVR